MATGKELHDLVKKSGYTIGTISVAVKRSPAALHKDFKEAQIKKELFEKVKKAIEALPSDKKGRKKRATKRRKAATLVTAEAAKRNRKAEEKADPENTAENASSEPKKRGRKPGSKNKPKTFDFNTSAASGTRDYRALYFEQLEINNKLIRRLLNL
ncbi:MAG: hypothetical protein ACT6QS_08770 [Flavobacteriales bacterium]